MTNEKGFWIFMAVILITVIVIEFFPVLLFPGLMVIVVAFGLAIREIVKKDE